MTWVATAVIGSTAVGLYSANKAAGAQSNAANQAADISQRQYEQTRADQAPWRAAGETALNKLIPLSDYKKFGMDQFQADPGYAFRFSEGQKALDRSAAARGGLVSGRALKEATRFGQEMGSQEYTNAFNRYQTERNAQLNPLQSLAGVGQSATNFIGNAGAANAANVGNAYGAAGQANASGYMGMANAAGQGVNQYLNYTSNNNLLNALQRNQNMQMVNTGGYSNVPAYMVQSPT
jgi:hypothetical protein